MAVSFEEARRYCVQHYVDRGYSEEHSTNYVGFDPHQVFRVYECIKKEEAFIAVHGKVKPIDIHQLANPKEGQSNE